MKHSELTFQLMVESVPNAILLLNRDGKIVYINNQAEKLFRYERIELIGQVVEVLLPHRYRKNHPTFRDSFFLSPKVRPMGAGRDLFGLKKDGAEFPIEIGLNPVVTADGTLVLASIIDITERKKAEQRFRLVVESAPNAMVLVNAEGTISLVNEQTEKLFGYEREELIGAKLEILLPERFRIEHPDRRNQFFQSPSVRSMGTGRDLFARRKNGSEVQVEIGLNPIDTDEGLMVLASIIDITERKNQEATLIRKNELEVKNKELEQFAFLASHDLQEPLRTVSNYIQILEEDYGNTLDSNANRHLKTIDQATKRMSVLVKALLMYARIGRDQKLTLTDLNRTLSEVLSDLENLILHSKAKIISEPLPSLNVYEVEFRQLLQNLITNAIKFSKKETDPEIKIHCRNEGEHWHFSVQDNGIGIESKYLDRIFFIFQRLHIKEEYEGHGIGLAHCKKIIELHNGRIWVESSIGIGSTFYFNIPILNP
ncbi:PAS domain S-box protein [Leptospira borgpetersenii serovar Ballum]|uniref:histidine kinase n=4 Tax=Leptospira TaxID=171 RepID=A0A0S2IR57_LEPBO|nr:PAS domain S-box protein [Leptospira borgpetersenii serovar Ballum]ANH00710.1 PAS domain S-box protein [Leptospira borgpetersenii str. 4E]EKR00527.1 PAS domain S-box protein [Leptospira borgpetersenii serovar Castellonis str. 200801910]EMO09745.1 PAS domain S-box protein [Leptospira borgpetersenii str. Noumea 25]MBF3373662.1 PAS domain S-box protein [Leptospira borgpetersenii serovar Arborea]QHE26729.1 PAS domain S-box protein [Leptospira borgpetersenii]